MRNNFNDRLDNLKSRMDSSNRFFVVQEFNRDVTPEVYMFNNKHGYMGYGALPMSNFSNEQNFNIVGKNSSSTVVG